jgi:hypothetical protein
MMSGMIIVTGAPRQGIPCNHGDGMIQNPREIGLKFNTDYHAQLRSPPASQASHEDQPALATELCIGREIINPFALPSCTRPLDIDTTANPALQPALAE